MLRRLISTARNLLRILFWPLSRLSRRRCDVLRFTLKGSPPPLPQKRPFWDRRPRPMSVRSFERRLERAAKDPALEVVLVDVQTLALGWSTVETLHQILERAGRGGAGKRVVAYLPEGATLRDYYVACGADEIWMAPSAGLLLTGLAVATTYLGEALRRVGITAQVEARGRYKTAGEPLVSDRMSAESEEMLGEILDEVERLVVPAVARSRRLGDAVAEEMLSKGPYGAEKAKELGLIDAVCYPDQLASRLAPAGRKSARTLRWPAYSRGRHLTFGRWLWQSRRLPVLELRGVIVDGKSPGVSGVVGAEDAVKALRQLRADPRSPAVVLYVDSRGGTVLGSDQVRREVERLAQKKPVVAYMADVAASGGYMIASAAHQVVARRATLTGSIGVVSFKLSAGRLVEKLGARRHVLRRKGHTGFASAWEPWSAAERSALRAMTDEHYRHFVDVVARGRRLPREQIERSAEGRVWTGAAALDRGLVDHLGGLSEALRLAREATPAARGAVVEALQPPRPRVPRLLLRGPLVQAAPWVVLALRSEQPLSMAIEPADLQIR